MGQTLIPKFIANTLRTLRSVVSFPAVLIGLSLLLAFLSISPVSAATSVSGTISSNTTWSVAESPFQVTDDVTVASGVTLTIEPGVTVKFDNLKALDINGTLIARGTSTSTITFTSSAASPAAGDWKFIRFNSSATSATFDGSGNYLSGSILQYCTVEYAGAGAAVVAGAVPAIYHISVSPFIDHSTIQHNGSLGLYIDASPAAGTIRITNNLFNDNLGGGMTLNAKADSSIIIENNTVTNSGGGNGIKFSVPGYGGAVTVTASVSNNFVSDNLGKGIWVSLSEPGQGTLTVSNNTIAGNAEEGLKLHIGGGVEVYGLNNAAAPSTVIASNNTITGNGDSSYDAVWTKADACPGHSHQFSITDNTIFNNPGRGLYFESNQCWDGDSRGNAVPSILTLSNNYIIQSGTALGWEPDDPKGAALYLISLGPMTVTGNRIHNNGSSITESTIWLQPKGPFQDGGTPAGSIAFKDNQISGNQGTNTITVQEHFDYDIERNSIHDNNTTNDFCSCGGTSFTWDLDDNWWGANSVALAESRIFHWTDDITFANVDFIPILTTPPTTAPPALPTNVAAQTGPTTIAFTWDANLESDIAGYKVHYDTDAAGYPYASSTDVGNVTSYTLSSLTTATTYYTAVSAYDSDGNESWVSTDVAVTTGATDPVITPADDASASEGDSLSLQLASFSDIEPADTHTASIQWGDGTSSVGIVSESSGSGTVSGSHTYADSGIFTVTVTVEDSGGGASSDTLTLTVSNIAPTVYAGSDSVVGGTAHYTLSPATFTDPGSADTHTATVDWGDGAITVAFVNEESRTVSSSHRYQDKGTFTVTVTVTDDDGASGSDSSQITVTSVPVTVAIPSVTGWGMLLLGSILTILIMFRLRKSAGHRPAARP